MTDPEAGSGEDSASRLVSAVKQMSVEDRVAFLQKLGEVVCLLCGKNAPCYCAPAYDE